MVMIVRSHSYRLIAFLLSISMTAIAVHAQSVKTPAEESGYSRYTQHEEVGRFLMEMSQASRTVRVQVIGKTLDAKDLAGASLYLCILSEEGADTPQKLNHNKATMLIFASQHGNEQSGKEAALKLIRDLALGDLRNRLHQFNVLVIPQTNPYGNFVNRRQNEQNLDLNRDHVKLEAPETQAIHRVFTRWMPEITLDVHEKGDDYYRVSTGCVSNLNIHESLQRYSRERIFPALEKSVIAAGFTWHEYLVTDVIGSASAAGVPDRPGERQARETLMRYSTTDLNDGRNSPGIYETLSFIQEGASRHDLPTLEARTRWQYAGIKGLLEIVAGNADEIHSMVRARRAELLQRARKPAPKNVVNLRMQYVRDTNEPELILKRFERMTTNAPTTATEQKTITEIVKNWFPKVESTLTVERPVGYLVPASCQDLVKTLLDHGIHLGQLTRDVALIAETYRVGDVVPAKDDYVAPEKIELEKVTNRITMRKGDFYISGDQPAANLIPCLLEPQSEYGLIRYRVFKLLPEKGANFPIARLPIHRKLPVMPFLGR
jgi:hypothetical protein